MTAFDQAWQLREWNQRGTLLEKLTDTILVQIINISIFDSAFIINIKLLVITFKNLVSFS